MSVVIKSLFYRLGRVRIGYLCLAPVLLLMVIFFGWYFLLYRDLIIAERQCEARVRVLEQRRLLLPDVQYQVSLLRQKNDELLGSLRTAVHKFAVLDSSGQRDHLLSNLDESGLSVLAFTPRQNKKKAFYERSLVEFKTLGTFDQIIRFLRKMNTCECPVRFKKTLIVRKARSLLLESALAFYTFEKEK